MQKNNKKKITWQLLWSRRYSPFVAASYFKTFLSDTAIWTKCPNKLYLPAGSLHDYYFAASELKEVCQHFKKYVLKQDIKSFCVKYEDVFKEWLSWSKSINEKTLAKLSNAEISRLVKEISRRLSYYGEWQLLAFIALEGLVKDAENFVRSNPNFRLLASSLSTPHLETKIMRAKLELLKLAAGSPNRQEAVKKYCQKYAWLNMYEFIDEPLRASDVLKNLPSKKLAKEEIKNYYQNRKANLASLKKLLTMIKDSKARRLVLIANKFSYLKEMRDDYRRQTYLISRPFWLDVARRTKLSFVQTNFLLADELVSAICHPDKKWARLAMSREKMYALNMDSGQFFIYHDKKSISSLKKLVREKILTQDIIGVPAWPGKVRGVARIVRHKDEFSKFVKGDILITAMTHPEFLPIMRQATAIVTDEGGVTCHAAITAREMNKPCIIGTKISTKVLQDNDKIEVDANRGVIRKI